MTSEMVKPLFLRAQLPHDPPAEAPLFQALAHIPFFRLSVVSLIIFLMSFMLATSTEL
jgi:hypothetical protein